MSRIRPSSSPIRSRWQRFALLLACLILAPLAGAQDREGAGDPANPGDREGLPRERMWYAPTAEDWKKPCLITWQRTWEDALAISKETQKAILICINMDGEIASEHYAGVRYRQPEVAKLYEPYVCVIASTYRHTPRDYDDQGRRILCPRFGSVTCGEHIAIEPILFEQYMDGQRVSPRHIMIELDGQETYDVFYTQDTASVFDSVRDGIAKRSIQPKPIVRGDRSIFERVESPDIRDREAVEAAYRQGDGKMRQGLLEAAGKMGGKAPLDLLRLAVFGLDVDLGKQARATLSQADRAAATDLIAEALHVPMEKADRDALIAALARIGEKSPRARWLATVQQGLGGESAAVDAKAWAKAQQEYEAAAASARDLGSVDVDRAAKAGAFRKNPTDPTACLELAEASLSLAFRARKTTVQDPRMARVFERHMFVEASRTATQAEKLGATPWRVDSVLALAAYYTGDVETAYRRAEKAVKAMPSGDPSWNSMAVLTVFAEARWTAIKKVMNAGRRLPHRWLSDVNATYAALRNHPHGSADQVLWHLNFLAWLGADAQIGRILAEGIGRFPDSSALHRRLRRRILMTKGVAELEAVYERMLKEKGSLPRLEWFSGYASVVAAEFHRRAQEADKAAASYDRAIAAYERASAGDPGLRDSTDQRVALAVAGLARLAFERGDDERALADLLASFERRPESAGTQDGLGITPADTGQDLLARLKEQGKDDPASKLEKALEALDPEFLKRD